MSDFHVTQWHPDKPGEARGMDCQTLCDALQHASSVMGNITPDDDTRVTIYFTKTGRWLEWWFCPSTGHWESDEM